MGLDGLLEGFPAFAIRSNDEHGVITCDGTGDFMKFGGIQSGSERLCAAGRRLEHEKVFRGANVEQEFAKRAGQGRDGGGLIRNALSGAITFPRLYQLQFVKVAGQRGLRNAHALLRKAAAKIFLIGDPLGRDQAKDLAVAKCFGCAHSIHLYI